MLSVLLIVAAAGLFLGWDMDFIKDLAGKIRSRVSGRQLAAMLLVLLALAMIPWGHQGDPEPQPAPSNSPLLLEGLFAGPTASDDACLIGCLCNELADEIEWDGMQQQPAFKTGVSLDELRKRARILRCRGMSIGDRQPAARDAIADYLDAKIGTDGGPLSPEQRSAWVTALRDVGRAANDAAR